VSEKMAKEKKEDLGQSDVEKSEPKLVRIFSQRIGEIKLQDGRSLKFGEVLMVTEEVADWLTKSFGALVKIID
jgi:hypothetical protein